MKQELAHKVAKFAANAFYSFLLTVAFSAVWLSVFVRLERINRFKEPVFKFDLSLVPLIAGAAFAIAVVLICIKVVFSRSSAHVGKLTLLWLGFVLWGVISSALSGAPVTAFSWWFVDASVILAGVVIAAVADELVEDALIASLLIAGVVAVVFLFARLKVPYVEGIYNPLGSAGKLSTFFTLAFSGAWMLAFRRQRVWIGASAVLFAFIAGMANNVAIALIVIINFIFIIWELKEKFSIKWAALTAACAITFVSGWALSPERIPHDKRGNEAVLEKMWRKSVKAEEFSVLGENFFAGTGPGLYSSGLVESASSELKRLSVLLKRPVTSVQPSCLAALKAGEYGFPGLLLLFIPLLLSAVGAFREREYAAAGTVGSIVLVMFFAPSCSVKIWALAVVLGAMCLWEKKKLNIDLKVAFAILYTFGIFATGSFTSAAWRFASSRIDMDRALKVDAIKRGDELPRLVRAWETSPLSVETNYTLASVMYRYDGWDRAIPLARKVLSLFPNHPGALQILAGSERNLALRPCRLEGQRDLSKCVDWEMAERYIMSAERLVKLNPYATFEAVQLLSFLKEVGEESKAQEIAAYILKENPDFLRVLRRTPALRGLLEEKY